MPDQNRYPYRCDYLKCLLDNTHFNGREIYDITIKMMEWLINIPHTWSTHTDTTPILIRRSKSAFVFDSDWIEIATYISFEHKEDLLAFRLAWGIHPHCVERVGVEC